MPGCDGAELGRRINADPELKSARLVLLTSSGHRGDASQFAELGFAGYLLKPVAQRDLLDSLMVVLGVQCASDWHSAVASDRDAGRTDVAAREGDQEARAARRRQPRQPARRSPHAGEDGLRRGCRERRPRGRRCVGKRLLRRDPHGLPDAGARRLRRDARNPPPRARRHAHPDHRAHRPRHQRRGPGVLRRRHGRLRHQAHRPRAPAAQPRAGVRGRRCRLRRASLPS